MKCRLFALAMFALLVLSGAWSHPAQAFCLGVQPDRRHHRLIP